MEARQRNISASSCQLALGAVWVAECAQGKMPLAFVRGL